MSSAIPTPARDDTLADCQVSDVRDVGRSLVRAPHISAVMCGCFGAYSPPGQEGDQVQLAARQVVEQFWERMWHTLMWKRRQT